MTYPDGQNVAFVYNAQGKLNSITGIINNIDYNAAGQMTKKDYSNSKSTIYNHDNRNLRLTELKTTGIQDFSYTYDNVGNIKSIADSIAGKTENFTYDDLDRVKTAGDGGYSIQYQYNAIGNMTSMIKDGKTTSFTYGATNNKPHAVTGMSVPVPVVGSFLINNGSSYTTTNIVTLNNISIGNPAYYMASEDILFRGAFWKTYSTSPSFLLSGSFGLKTVYFKVRNADGESNVKSDTIELRLNPEDVYRDDDGLNDSKDPYPKTANLSISSNAPTTGVPLYGVGTDMEICSYSISPESKIFGYYGGTGSVSVTASLSGCDWTALSNDNWITITSGSNGIGNGTVSYSVSSNASMDSRTGTMTIAELTFTITQSGFQACIDNDGDGYGNPGDTSCPKEPETDCNDNDNTVNPGAVEICCDNKDNNCNNQTDEGCADYGLSIYFDNVENWLIVAYTEYNQTECDYSVYLKIMDSNGVLVPAEEILGLSANPYLISDNATSPKVRLAFDSNTKTAIVSFTDTSGFRIVQILNIVGK